MRKRFEVQLTLGKTPIEKVLLPLKSRDELPPILAGLKWIFLTPEINAQVFTLLEEKLVAGKKATGRAVPAWTCGRFWSWGWCVWGWIATTTDWSIWPITTVCCGKSWA